MDFILVHDFYWVFIIERCFQNSFIYSLLFQKALDFLEISYKLDNLKKKFFDLFISL